MGVSANVGFHDYPRQGSWLNRRMVVCFDYDTANTIGATCVREDDEEPGIMILRLDDGRYVLSTECQFRPAD